MGLPEGAWGAKTLSVDLDFRRGLRAAVYRGDVAEIVAMLTTEAVQSMPQFAGDALLVALAGDAPVPRRWHVTAWPGWRTAAGTATPNWRKSWGVRLAHRPQSD